MTTSMINPAGLVLMATVLSAVGSAAQDVPRFSVPGDWVAANIAEAKDLSLFEFVKPGETLENWTALYSITQSRRSREERAPLDTYELLRAKREERCPGVTEWRLHEQDSVSVLYESSLTADQCGDYAREWQLGRIVHGGKTKIIAVYASRSDLSDEVRAAWMGWLRRVALQ